MPVFHKDAVVVFQGDSITDGGRWLTGNDYNHIMGQDYAYIVAAQIGARFPERGLIFLNRGLKGNTAADLAARWQNDTLDLKPSLLSILVGINDALGPRSDTDTYEATYDKLIIATQAALPDVKIVLGTPFILPVGRYSVDYGVQRAKVEKLQAAVNRLGAKYHLPVVAYQKAFDAACRRAPAEKWSWDGIHPTYAGHDVMAREWLQTVNAFWPNG